MTLQRWQYYRLHLGKKRLNKYLPERGICPWLSVLPILVSQARAIHDYAGVPQRVWGQK